MNLSRLVLGTFGGFALVALAHACAPADGPQTGTQTNWLILCDADTDCGDDTRCLCGACSREVNDDPSVCEDLPGSTNVDSEDAGVIALCGGEKPPVDALCLVRCKDDDCPEGSQCVADICAPVQESTAAVSIDTSNRHQTLLGLGAGLAYIDREIIEHPAKSAIFDAMFAESGFDVVRLRNAYLETRPPDFGPIQEILDAANSRMDQPPTIVLNSASPPAELKQNGSTYCDGNPDTCTLTRNTDGDFDYEGLANFLRSSIDAYDAAGISADYFSIQNDPNYVPPAGQAIETCRFLPQEGSARVSVGGTDVDIDYPGYQEALSAVLDAFSSLSSIPRMAGPDTTGVSSSVDFLEPMDIANLDAIGFHMYGTDPLDPDLDAMAALAEFGQDGGPMLLQTEMGGDGIQTALLAQQGFVEIGTSMYLQTTFVAPAGLTTPDTGALVALTDDGFVLQDPYYALKHFAFATEPGWVRVDATSKDEDVSVSAWMSPDENQLAVILINPLSSEEVVALEVDDAYDPVIAHRTVFPGVERFADLGPFSRSDSFVLPASSVLTLSFEK